MTLWLNITSSSRWSGNPVGIIRVEAELAKGLHGKVKYFEFRGNEIVETNFLASREKKPKSYEKSSGIPRSSRVYTFFETNRNVSAPWQILRITGIIAVLIIRVLPTRLQERALTRIFNILQRFATPARRYFSKVKTPHTRKHGNTYSAKVNEQVKHPFAPGDTVMTAGLDWTYQTPEYLNLVKAEIDIKVISWIYDVIPFSHPEVISHKEHQATLFKHFAMTAKVSDLVVFISKSSQNEYEKFCKATGFSPPQGKTITLATDINDQGKATTASRGISHLEVSKNYILSVGTLEPRKNYWTLINARNALSAELDIQLVIVGRAGWLTADLIQFVQNLAGNNVVILPNVSDSELHDLYHNARAYMSASVAEGFNLPVLEAQSIGIPVIISEIPTHRELFPAANFIETFDVPAWSRAMEDVAHNRFQRNDEPVVGKKWSEYAAEVLDAATHLV